MSVDTWMDCLLPATLLSFAVSRVTARSMLLFPFPFFGLAARLALGLLIFAGAFCVRAGLGLVLGRVLVLVLCSHWSWSCT